MDSIKFTDAKIKERIVEGGYGRFDLLTFAFSEEQLLKLKPRLLYKSIIERFGLTRKELTRQQLNSWHLRYRKAHDKDHGSHSSILTVMSDQNPQDNAYKAMLDKELEAMKNFVPADPSTARNPEPPLIRVVRSQD